MLKILTQFFELHVTNSLGLLPEFVSTKIDQEMTAEDQEKRKKELEKQQVRYFIIIAVKPIIASLNYIFLNSFINFFSFLLIF